MSLVAAIAPPLINAAGNLGVSLINRNAQDKTNKQSREHTEYMYEKQRQDNLSQWHMQNDYNSPTSQMNRLREAGLNPNLVYGKGADNVSAPIASTSAQSWNPTAPRLDNFNIGDSLSSYFDYQIKGATLDNLKTQNTVMTQEAALKAAQVANTTSQTARSQFDLDLASELRQNSADYARENLRKLQADTKFQISENERRQMQNTSNLKEAAERILNMRSQRATNAIERQRIESDIKRIQSSTQLQQLDIELKKNGINPSDPIYMRVLGRILGTAVDGTLYDGLKGKLSDWWDDFKPW